MSAYFSIRVICLIVHLSWLTTANLLAQDEPVRRPVVFNQEWLESSWVNQYPTNPDSLLAFDEQVGNSIDPTDRVAVIKHVLTHAPEPAIVYPSERYYYFKFWCGHRLISGNLRFCDVDQGKIHFGYFDEFDSRFLYTGTIENGVNGFVTISGAKVVLIFSGLEKSFRLDRSWLDSTGLFLLDGEELVSGILDESGYYFWLVHNQAKRRLYFVLNDKRLPERTIEIASGGVRFLIGQSSRFIFYVDDVANRKILVGVSEDNIRANNYFDGPFDQVPPDLNIKPILEEIYPYVQDRGGIDEHGNFIALHHSRVAISPYVKYSDTSSFLVFAAQVLKPKTPNDLAFVDLVYESKMDFHLIVRGVQVGDSNFTKEQENEDSTSNEESIK